MYVQAGQLSSDKARGSPVGGSGTDSAVLLLLLLLLAAKLLLLLVGAASKAQGSRALPAFVLIEEAQYPLHVALGLVEFEQASVVRDSALALVAAHRTLVLQLSDLLTQLEKLLAKHSLLHLCAVVGKDN